MSNNNVADQSAPSDDVLWGVPAIANFIGRSIHEAQYLIRTKAITVGRLGPKTIIASKRQLRRELTPNSTAA